MKVSLTTSSTMAAGQRRQAKARTAAMWSTQSVVNAVWASCERPIPTLLSMPPGPGV